MARQADQARYSLSLEEKIGVAVVEPRTALIEKKRDKRDETVHVRLSDLIYRAACRAPGSMSSN